MKELGIYKQLAQLPYLTSYKQLIEGAIRLDIFSNLREAVLAEELAERMGWDKANTKVLLEALYSIGFVTREAEAFKNTEDANRYLIAESPEYMGSVTLFFGSNQGMDAGDVAKQVKEGAREPEQMQKMEQTMDFVAYGEMMRKVQSGIRQWEILELVRTLPENDRIDSILDLGCGAGMLGLALARERSGRKVVLFDQPQMKALIEGSVEKSEISERAEIRVGDFLKDDIGNGYDLILASSVMLFAAQDLVSFMKKLYAAVKERGVVVCERGNRIGLFATMGYDLGLSSYEAAGYPSWNSERNGSKGCRASWFSSREQNSSAKYGNA